MRSVLRAKSVHAQLTGSPIKHVFRNGALRLFRVGALRRTALAAMLITPLGLAGSPAGAGPLNPLDYASLGSLSTAGGTLTFNTDLLTVTGAGGLSFNTGTLQSQAGGSDIAVFTFDQILIGTGTNVQAVGSRALAILSQGNATISSTINVSGAQGSSGSSVNGSTGGNGQIGNDDNDNRPGAGGNGGSGASAAGGAGGQGRLGSGTGASGSAGLAGANGGDGGRGGQDDINNYVGVRGENGATAAVAGAGGSGGAGGVKSTSTSVSNSAVDGRGGTDGGDGSTVGADAGNAAATPGGSILAGGAGGAGGASGAAGSGGGGGGGGGGQSCFFCTDGAGSGGGGGGSGGSGGSGGGGGAGGGAIEIGAVGSLTIDAALVSRGGNGASGGNGGVGGAGGIGGPRDFNEIGAGGTGGAGGDGAAGGAGGGGAGGMIFAHGDGISITGNMDLTGGQHGNAALGNAASGLLQLAGTTAFDLGTATIETLDFSGNLAIGGTVRFDLEDNSFLNQLDTTLTLGDFFVQNGSGMSDISVFSSVNFTARSQSVDYNVTLQADGSFDVDIPLTPLLLNGTAMLPVESASPTLLLPGDTLTGAGTHSGAITALAGSSIAATAGDMELGDATSFAGFLSQGTVDTQTNTITLNSLSFANLAGQTTVGGGTLAAPNGTLLAAGAQLNGNGSVDAAVVGQAGSSITAQGGDLTVGDASSAFGFAFDGALATGANTVTLRSAGLAGLGAATTMNGGRLDSNNGIQLAAGRTLTGDGTVDGQFINQGTVTATGAGIEFSGDVSGAGAFLGTSTTFSGTFRPGNSPAAVVFENMTLTGELEMEIGGLIAGTEHDQLLGLDGAFSTIELGGILDIQLIGLGGGSIFDPVLGDAFDLIVASDIVGMFDTVDLPVLTGNLYFDLQLDTLSGPTSGEVLRLIVASRDVVAMPAPAGLALFTLGLVGIGVMRHRRG